jgi:DNA-binding transcriptional ArsR family regulator
MHPDWNVNIMYLDLDNQIIMLNVHVLTPGANVFNVYLKISRSYSISEIVLLKEEDAGSDIEESIVETERDCEKRDIPCTVVTFRKNDYEDLLEKILDLRRQYQKRGKPFKLYFNITAGRKDVAIMAFMGSLWVDGIGYYLTKEMDEPIEFPVPKVSLAQLEQNQLHRRILELLSERSGGAFSQSDLRRKIGVNPNNHKDLSAQTLSSSISALEEYGLLKKQPEGRETQITITLSGRLAHSMLHA